MDTPGIECRPIRDITGDEMFNEVLFTDARIPADCRLGDEGQGWQVAMGTLGHERVGTAGLAITMAADLRAMISAARAVNPDALDDPEIRERIARAYTDIEFTKLLNYRALTKIIKGQKNWPEVPLAKLQWSHLAQTLAELAVDLLGPAGLARQGRARRRRRRHVDPPLLFQRYTSIGAGATEVQKNRPRNCPSARKMHAPLKKIIRASVCTDDFNYSAFFISRADGSARELHAKFSFSCTLDRSFSVARALLRRLRPPPPGPPPARFQD